MYFSAMYRLRWWCWTFLCHRVYNQSTEGENGDVQPLCKNNLQTLSNTVTAIINQQ